MTKSKNRPSSPDEQYPAYLFKLSADPLPFRRTVLPKGIIRSKLGVFGPFIFKPARIVHSEHSRYNAVELPIEDGGDTAIIHYEDIMIM